MLVPCLRINILKWVEVKRCCVDPSGATEGQQKLWDGVIALLKIILIYSFQIQFFSVSRVPPLP